MHVNRIASEPRSRWYACAHTCHACSCTSDSQTCTIIPIHNFLPQMLCVCHACVLHRDKHIYIYIFSSRMFKYRALRATYILSSSSTRSTLSVTNTLERTRVDSGEMHTLRPPAQLESQIKASICTYHTQKHTHTKMPELTQKLGEMRKRVGECTHKPTHCRIYTRSHISPLSI